MCAITVSGALTSFMEPVSAHIAGALALADHQFGDVDREALRNLVRQALDFDGAGDDFEQSALHLDALRFAADVCTGTVTRMRLVRSMRFRSACSRVPLIGIDLLVHHHDRRGFAARIASVKMVL